MKRIKFAGDARKRPFVIVQLYETVDDDADSVKLILLYYTKRSMTMQIR